MHAHKYKSNSIGTITTLMFVMLLAYFSYHVISGQRGLLALMTLSKQVEKSREQLDETSVKRLRLKHRVSLLRNESLDLDMLDEQARRLLGYVGKAENIYTLNENE